MNNPLRLHEQMLYHSLFVLSMMLYHSTDYYNVINGAQTKSRFVLCLLDHISLCFLQGLFISIFIIGLILIIVKTCFLRQANYTIQLIQNLIHPIQIYILIISIKETSSSNKIEYFNTENKLFLPFLTTTIISIILICVKNLKIHLNYEIPQKSFNRLVREEYFLLIGKLLINITFSIFFENKLLAYIAAIGSINLLINIMFVYRVIFEHPKIQFMYLVTQFYQWTPLVTLLLGHFEMGSRLSLLVLNLLITIAYFWMCLTKTKILVGLLEKKYLECIKNVCSQQYNTNEKTLSRKLITDSLIPMLSISIEMLFDQFSLYKFRWSEGFRTQILLFFEQKASQSKLKAGRARNSAIYPKSTSKKKVDTSISQANDKSLQNYEIFGDSQMLSNQNGDFFKAMEQKRRQKISNLLRNLVYPYINAQYQSSQHTQLRYFLCYNFPHLSNRLKNFLFQSYYLNSFRNNESFIDSIQSKICHTYLLTKIGNHQSIHTYIDNLESLNKPSCFFKEFFQYHPKFNDVLKEQQLCKNIIKRLEYFIENENMYLEIFKSVLQNKENVRVYYSERKKLRVNIESLLSQYASLNGKNQIFCMVIDYIVNHFLQKTPLKAYENLSQAYCKDIQIKLQLNKPSLLLKPSMVRNHSINKISNSKTSFPKQESSLSQSFYPKENLHCIVSGLKDKGKLRASSSGFKKLMQLDQKQPPNSSFKQELDEQRFSSLSNMNIDSFIPLLWRQRHTQIMNQIDFHQKPVDHWKSKCYLISLKENNFMDVNFKLYYFLLFQTDLLTVIDFQKYQLLKQVIVKKVDDQALNDDNAQKPDRVVFAYGGRQLRISLDKDKQVRDLIGIKQQSMRQQKVQIFGIKYVIQSTLFPQTQIPLSHLTTKFISASPIQPNNVSGQYISSRFQQKRSEQLFTKYKQNLNLYGNILMRIKVVVAMSILFYWVVFHSWISMENVKRDQMLALIENKMFLSNKFICVDAFTSIDIGVMYNLAKGMIFAENGQVDDRLSFLLTTLISSSISKDQSLRKYSAKSFTNSKSSFTELLLDPYLIPGYNVSFLTHSLIKEVHYYSTLTIFSNLSILDKFRIFYSGAEIDFQFYNSSFLLDITPKDDQIISQFLKQIITTKEYNFGENGFLNRLSMKENEVLIELKNARLVYFAFLQAGFVFFTTFIVGQIISMKKSILENYNEALRVSQVFLIKFRTETERLKNYIVYLKDNQQQNLLNEINPSKLKGKQKLQYQSLQQKIPYKSQMIHLNIPKYLFQSVVFPFLRYFVMFVIVLSTFNNAESIQDTLHRYSRGLQQFFKMKRELISGFEKNLWLMKYENDQRDIEGFVADFHKSIRQVQQMDKKQMLSAMFPYNPQIAHKILYKSGSQITTAMNINTGYFMDSQSFLQQSAYLLLTYQRLSIHLTVQKFKYSSLQNKFRQTYTKINKLNYLSDEIVSKSFEILLQKDRDTYVGCLVWVVLFLIIEFLMGTRHFNQILHDFYQEFLNLGTVEDFQKEKGFSKFVNLSRKGASLFVSQDNIKRYLFF